MLIEISYVRNEYTEECISQKVNKVDILKWVAVYQ